MHLVLQGGHQIFGVLKCFEQIQDNTILEVFYDKNLNAQEYFGNLENVILTFMPNMLYEKDINAWYLLDGAPPHKGHQIWQK